jgi:hypothetical protein
VIQELAVAAIVAVAALYVGAKYLPAAWRRRIVFALARSEGESKLARWLGTGSSCGTGCASCKACAPATPEAADGASTGTSPPDGRGSDGRRRAARRSDARRVIKLHQRR